MSAQTIPDLLAAAPGDRSDPAIVAFGRESSQSATREEVLEHVARLAAGLQAAGLERGDRAALIAPNGRRWVESALAVLHAGAAIVPLDTQMADGDLANALADCAPCFIFTTSGLKKRFSDSWGDHRTYLLDEDADQGGGLMTLLANDPIEPVPSPEDLAAIFYTSGTTGPPKGVPLTHANLYANVQGLRSIELVSEADRVAVPLPFHHVYPFAVGILITLALGGTLIVPHSLVGPQIIRALHDGEATVLLGVPRLYEALWSALQQRVENRGRLPAAVFRLALNISMATCRYLHLRLGRVLFAPLHARLAPDLRLVVSGGAALDPDLARRFQGFGWKVATGYGLSETSPILTFNAPPLDRPDSAGVALPGVELAIDATDGSSRTGELLARGPNVFAGYWNLPAKTEAAFEAGDWFRTGDLAQLDGDGYLYLHGRKSSTIVHSGGENIDPERVENVLEAADEIREAGVLEHDDRLAAVVLPEAGWARTVDEGELGQAVEKIVSEQGHRLPGHHRPGLVRVTRDPLPRTPLGKLRRHKLEERFEALESGAAPRRASRTPLSPRSMAPEDQQLLSDPAVKASWDYLADRFDDRRVTPDSDLALDLGLDSLAWVDLTLSLRERAGVELDESTVARVQNVRDLLQAVAAAGTSRETPADLVAALRSPDQVLESRDKKVLAGRGPVRTAGGLVLLALTRLFGRIFFRMETHGSIPAAGPYLIVPRHLSAADPLVLVCLLNMRQLESVYWTGWTGLLFSSPLRHWFSVTARVLPIDPDAAPKRSMALAAACLECGRSLIWFAEGRRSPDGRLQPFKPGVGAVLKAHPVPVIPVWIEGTREILPPGRLLPRPGHVRVVIGNAIDPERFEGDPRDIASLIHSELAALGEPTPSRHRQAEQDPRP